MARMSKRVKAAAMAREAKRKEEEAATGVAAPAGEVAPPAPAPPAATDPLVIALPATEDDGASDPPTPADFSDWMKLPGDLLDVVLKKLTDTDLILSAGTCRTLRRAVDEVLPFPKFPVLIFNREVDDQHFESKFYCFWRKRFYTLSFPYHSLSGMAPEEYFPRFEHPSHNQVFQGISRGWMIIADDYSDLYLYNPISGKIFRNLPPIATIDFIEAFYDGQGKIAGYIINDGTRNVVGGPTFPRSEAYRKVVMSQHPESDECTVMLTFHFSKTVFAKPGDKKWKTVASKRVQDDILPRRGEFYTIRRDRHLQIWDSRGKKKCSINLTWPIEKIPMVNYQFLVPSPSGDLFYIRVNKTLSPITNSQNSMEFYAKSSNRILPYMKYFSLYKVDIAKKTVGEELDYIGNYAFLISNNDAKCLSTLENPQFYPNCIYHTIDFYVAVGVYHMQTRTCHYMELSDESGGYVGWQPLSWMTPSLH